MLRGDTESVAIKNNSITPESIEILNSHVKELIELLKYDGKTLGDNINLCGQTVDEYEEKTKTKIVSHEDARQAVGLWAMCLNADEHREAQYNARFLIREYIMQCEEMEKELKNSIPIHKGLK